MRRLGVGLACCGFALLVVAGCGKRTPPAGPDEPGAGTQSSAAGAEDDAAPPSDDVFAPLENAVERARGVQDTVDAQAERLRKEIEKAEGGEN